MQKMKAIPAIKKFMEQADPIAPDGGRPFEGIREFKDLSSAEKAALGALAAAELGVEIEG